MTPLFGLGYTHKLAGQMPGEVSIYDFQKDLCKRIRR